ncbi:MAG TPA: hypothetical protein DCY75_02415 [Clostridiales bacterium]|nr:hypothetical protein [Clostridiales bacterium]
MLCQHCNLKPAVFHYTEVVNGLKEETHLCAGCFEELRGDSESSVSNDFGGGWLESMLFGLPARSRTIKRCPACGWTSADIVKTGKVGCSDCYKAFEAELGPSLRRLSAGEPHKGRIPAKLKNATAPMDDQNRLHALKRQLKEAVDKEEYEKAASLRDQIREMEGN